MYIPNPTSIDRADYLENVVGDYGPNQQHGSHDRRDGERMPQRYRDERLIDRAAPAFLESQRDSEQPAHGRVDAVIRAQPGQYQPGPQFAYLQHEGSTPGSDAGINKIGETLVKVPSPLMGEG